MRILFMGVILFAIQLNTLQSRPVVHLQPHRNAIEVGWNGSLLELIHAPPIVHLPKLPPKADAQGVPWSVEVKNLGPSPVTITNETTHFDTRVSVGQSIRIKSSGTAYLLKH